MFVIRPRPKESLNWKANLALGPKLVHSGDKIIGDQLIQNKKNNTTPLIYDDELDLTETDITKWCHFELAEVANSAAVF